MLPLVWVEIHKGRLDCIGSQTFHLLQDAIVKILSGLQLITLIKVALKLLVADFVALLVLAILLRVLLDGVVGEMDVEIGALFEAELGGGSSDVALGVPVGLKDAVEGGQKHIVADIELPPLVQQRLLHVLLQDEGPQGAIAVLLSGLQPQPDVLQSMADGYAVASVAVLPRLHDPNIPNILPTLLPLLKLSITL